MSDVETRLQHLESENKRLADELARLTEDSTSPDGPLSLPKQVNFLAEDVADLEIGEHVHEAILRALVVNLAGISPAIDGALRAAFANFGSEIDEDCADVPLGSPSHEYMMLKFRRITSLAGLSGATPQS